MKEHETHTQLPGLKAMWDLDDNLLNEVLFAFTNENFRPYEAIGYADDFLSFMDGSDFNIPVDVWESFCESADNGMSHEIGNNPF